MNNFTTEEVTYLQEALTDLRALTFNRLMAAKHREQNTEECEAEYYLIRSIRDKVYALNGRDTLALEPHYTSN